MFPNLETERLILREITLDDAEGIFACFSNDNVTRFYGQDSLETIDQARGFVDFFAKNFKEQKGMRWGIERKGEKGLIGTIGFNAWSPKHKRAEIGYEIHPDHWRKGYMSEAVSKILSYGSETLGLTRIGAVVFIENAASNNLLTKMGFQKEGILKKYMYQNGKAYDTYVYSFLPQK
ncbi:GNAT family N-acetyltransferase [Bacillus swezeyi]|uniref:GNAT family N-acetyltransferase n=1 Tax=Bacillus swezeyi TaxID=1925020 RepID=A0A1R1RLL2_9BACI|nr:GNAT family N-acetyltransferase [Bacillus swezeyi]MEC1260025.1 GNAT family N-acetyltransferase [Bacillus swezeyi]MED2929743.1 GNAT family N-acetyltransferase [Bacillus swezeyi]MED2963230.1 GNAT family N-acetyltransferase [Bacillus swezeyi]MED3073181.1 GNAT family N-acetyltransferase [Bacillus swezeyi]MED3082740.1 GNAT family N-acetyltransferase [Bacillus swezeyi]